MLLVPGSNRRQFLTTLGAGSIGGWASGSLAGARAATAAEFLPADATPVAAPDYLFAQGLTYFGTATMGPCSRRVVDGTMRAWYELETNPTGMGYGQGTTTLAAAERVREQAADLLGCGSTEIVVTRSTTDGMNAIAQGLRFAPGDRVLTTDQEHEGGSSCWDYVAKQDRVEIDTVRIAPADRDTRVLVERFAAAITSTTRVISVSHVLSSTGLRMPIAEIAALAKSQGVLCVVDGAQGVGSIPVNVKSLGCHAYATSGHKWLMAPKGTGLLYLSAETDTLIKPIQLHDSRAYYSHSSGVGNIPGVVGLGIALDSVKTIGIDAIERHNVALRNRLYDGLTRISALTVVSVPPGPLATPLVTFALPAVIDSAVFATMLREKHKTIVKVVPKRWLNGIRLSPHIFNTEKEVDALLKILRAELS